MFSRTLQDIFYTSRRRSGNGYDRGAGYEKFRDDEVDECKPMAYEIEDEKQDHGIVLLSDLVLLARDQPDQWVCEDCNALHPVARGDSPLRPNLSSCPRGWQRSPHNRHGHPSFRLSHRHIQLAFKYTRLRKWRHHLHLRRLLAESHAAFTPNPLCAALDGEFSAYPKIVNGRFLVFSTWTYTPGDQNPSERGIGALRVCEHQSFVGDARLLPPGVGPHHAPAPKTALARIIRSAFKRPEHEICSSCPLCPTDFSVQVTPERAIVRVWQDFGGDGSPLDPAWTVHTGTDSAPEELDPDLLLLGLPGGLPPRVSPARELKSGSIRESFGHCMREALHDIRNRKESCEAMGNIYIF